MSIPVLSLNSEEAVEPEGGSRSRGAVKRCRGAGGSNKPTRGSQPFNSEVHIIPIYIFVYFVYFFYLIYCKDVN